MHAGVRRLAAVLLEFPAHPASVPDAASIPVALRYKIKSPSFLSDELFILMVEAAGIGLAGRAFACMRMPLRATNSTQVLFVLRPSPPVRTGREFNSRPISMQQIKTTPQGCRFYLLVGRRELNSICKMAYWRLF
jgi:hypothetical protein